MDEASWTLDLSRRLSTLPDRDAFLGEASQALTERFDTDAVWWVEVDLAGGVVEIRTVGGR